MEFSGACPKVNQAWGIPYKDLTNQRPGNSGNLAEHEQKFYQASGSPIMSSSTKFEVNPASDL